IQPPSTTAFSPTSGTIGTEITVSGSGFQDLTSLDFNGVIAVGFTIDSDAQVRGTVPVGATDGPLTATNPAGSAPSSVDFTVVTTPSSFSFNATDDTFIRSSKRTRNYGSDDELRIKEASTVYVTFLKFNVAGLSSAVSRATLRLHVINGSNDGGSVYAVSNDYNDGSGPWKESGLVWNNAPTLSESPLSSIGPIAIGEVAEFDVLAAISGNGTFSFAIKSSSTDVIKYDSKEGTIAPELVIETSSAPVPSITSFSPSSGVPGNQVTITGLNFFGVSGVAFNGVAVSSFTANSNTEIRATVPTGVSSGPISITSAFGTGVSAQPFVVSGSASIDSFSPTSGSPGTEVTITGQNLAGTNRVAFNGAVAASFTLDSATQVRATVPSDATTGTIEITSSSGSATSSSEFTVVVPSGGTFTFNPSDDAYVRSSRPTQNSGGSAELRVRLSSTDYDSYLKFDVSGLSGSVFDARLRLRVIDDGPDGGRIYLVGNNLNGSSEPWTESNLTFSTAPQFSGIPVSSMGPVSIGQTVEFDVTSVVNGNGVFSFVISSENSNTSKYSSKEGVAPPELIISTGSGSPNTPSIASFTPPNGPVGSEVTIAGSNLTGVTAVTFNGVTASTFTVVSSTEIRATVPSSASSGRIRMSAPSGTATSGTDFDVLAPPSILSFNPAGGPVGTQVTILGA
ncbi:DNRLRE domain-containing protein, partial [bacterium]|nr:DNRLRE domain-containing protein [bacterium]